MTFRQEGATQSIAQPQAPAGVCRMHKHLAQSLPEHVAQKPSLNLANLVRMFLITLKCFEKMVFGNWLKTL